MEHSPTTYQDFHGRLLRDTFGRNIADRDAPLLFTIFHYFRVELSRPQVLTEYAARPEANHLIVFNPLDLRRCGEALASVWAGDIDVRAEPSHWFFRWRDEWGGYLRVKNLSPEDVARLRELIGQLERHPFVKRLVTDGSLQLRARLN